VDLIETDGRLWNGFIRFIIGTGGGIVVNTVMNLCVLQKAGNLTSWVPISFSRRTLLHGVTWLLIGLQQTPLQWRALIHSIITLLLKSVRGIVIWGINIHIFPFKNIESRRLAQWHRTGLKHTPESRQGQTLII
jgi:hypothetical protein